MTSYEWSLAQAIPVELAPFDCPARALVRSGAAPSYRYNSARIGVAENSYQLGKRFVWRFGTGLRRGGQPRQVTSPVFTLMKKNRAPFGFTILGYALSPVPAYADGLGGLGVAPALFFIGLGIAATIWAVVWFVVRAWTRWRQARAARESASGSAVPRKYWLKDPEIPIGLRVLALVQYGLAFFYSLIAVFLLPVGLAFVNLLIPFSTGPSPGYMQNEQVAARMLHNLLFSVLFAVLAALSANGYCKRPTKKFFNLGVALGWLCLGNAFLFVLLHGSSFDFDGITPLFGVTVLLVLNLRYRRYFGVDQRSHTRSKG